MNVDDEKCHKRSPTLECLAAHSLSKSFTMIIYDGRKTIYTIAVHKSVMRAVSGLVDSKVQSDPKQYAVDMDFLLKEGEAEAFIQLLQYVYNPDITRIPKRNLATCLRLASWMRMHKHFHHMRHQMTYTGYCSELETHCILQNVIDPIIEHTVEELIWTEKDKTFRPEKNPGTPGPEKDKTFAPNQEDKKNQVIKVKGSPSKLRRSRRKRHRKRRMNL